MTTYFVGIGKLGHMLAECRRKENLLLAEQVDKLLDGLEYNAVDYDANDVAVANKNFGPEGVYAEGWGQAVFHLRPKLRALILQKSPKGKT